MKRPQRIRPKRAPNWEKPPRPIAGGIKVLGRCRSRQGVLILVEDIVTLQELDDYVALKLINPALIERDLHPPTCRHCGREYESMRRVTERAAA